MPELPEIETVKLQLRKVLIGQKLLESKFPQLAGKKVVGIERKGKVLLINFGPGLDLGFHFKMTGQLIYEAQGKRIVGGHPTEDFVNKMPSKHTRAVFHLSGGTLYFNDQRMFGWIMLNPKFVDKLGPEPFELSVDQFISLISKRKKPIKLVLMDQEIISGVGNIYANDACWEAKVNPRRLANTLTAKQYHDLYIGVVRVLREGIKYGGATAVDAKYIDLHGLGGHYQEHFRVYDREGEMCHRGDGIIHRFELGGRGTYYCPKCQV
ncbi:MAG: Formamidopyrimidine-DNA glycosylase [Candidatus Amesbacteria bacterium GW2011_GWA2_47_11b]|uniref:Formamidopyrimidine-DNA glycosylase n=2 Tax=Candidatus Amesiibacteriota TaxID=1752730 RepID=A0A0G1SJP8_9BACT|nr:MAG: Formamidopyrimidine-DNA glycosylase [Microgenomates group bacterium GW2011_GWC1_46_20]KKU57147.1 MAG: Formamidopyrimidine-DNA glycosylase [Candidatus Amesbacteria bacterium GW2011_GWA2_47_11b]KKU69704.1 MAG: Formamidopyrimidine-DNA glycosylase [Candidatus Amesbacteria bacterium GW2011_GWA1_47_20]